MQIEQLQHEFERVQANLADGPILPSVTVDEIRSHLASRLPAYACPLFLRLCPQAELTGTFKYAKTDLVRQGFNPSQCADPLYFNHPELRAYVALDAPVYDSILAGAIRL